MCGPLLPPLLAWPVNNAVEFFVGVRLLPGVPAEQFADFALHASVPAGASFPQGLSQRIRKARLPYNFVGRSAVRLGRAQ